MENYYNRLGVSRYASGSEIKAAYKRLALKYHPDRNPLNPEAEEIFKDINTAYHVLSDPTKKAQYDRILDFRAYQPPKVTYYHPQSFNSSRPPQRTSPGGYTFNRNYFKYQAIAILIVLFISSVVISITRLNKYLEEKEKASIRAQNNQVIAHAYTKFNMGDFYGALKMVQNLANQHPSDYELYMERNKMVEDLYMKARQQYALKDYENAIFNLLVVKEFQNPMRLETWDYLARCFLAINDHKKAVEAYEYIYLRDKYNIELVLRIATIYHYELNSLDNALEYYERGKALFKERQTQLYGAAFELVMDPHKTPNVYYEVFYNRAKANFAAQNYEIAITDCNWATFLRPNKGEPYFIRASCYNITQETKRACKDYKMALSKGYKAENKWDFCNI